MAKSPSILTSGPNPGESLTIASHGRKTAVTPLPRLNLGQVAAVSRTVRRVPEVIVKVSGGGRDSAGVKAHLSYIDRHGKLDIETDAGSVPADKATAQDLLADWNLDALPRDPGKGAGKRPPKAVHNIVLSMPAKVPPEKVLAAAKVFAKANFGGIHRYAMVLHTDTKHPHVHVVVKAEREDGTGRLNIYKATLKTWREQFAQAMRDQGIEANATPFAVRGATKRLKDPMVHAQRRASRNPGQVGSTFLRDKAQAVMDALTGGRTSEISAGEATLASTRAKVVDRWQQTADQLDQQGETDLAASVRRFISAMPKVMTDQQKLAAAIAARLRGRSGQEDRTDQLGERGKGR